MPNNVWAEKAIDPSPDLSQGLSLPLDLQAHHLLKQWPLLVSGKPVPYPNEAKCPL